MSEALQDVALSDADLVRAIETAFWHVPEIPGRVERLAIPGLLGRITNTGHPMANVVSASLLTDENIDTAIAEVVRLVTERNVAFGWVVGETSTPTDLRARLTAAGFFPVVTLAGMATRDLDVDVPLAPGVTVRTVEADDRAAVIELTERSFQLPTDTAELMADMALASHAANVSTGYVACDATTGEPIAFGAATYSPDAPRVLLLGGAATHPDHRGKGAYRALVARRFADARARGCTAAVIQAFRTTSAPICARLGLSEVCNLDVYVRAPDGAAVPPKA